MGQGLLCGVRGRIFEGHVDIEAVAPEGEVFHVYIKKQTVPSRSPTPHNVQAGPSRSQGDPSTTDRLSSIYVVMSSVQPHHEEDYREPTLAVETAFISVREANEVADDYIKQNYLSAADHAVADEEDNPQANGTRWRPRRYIMSCVGRLSISILATQVEQPNVWKQVTLKTPTRAVTTPRSAVPGGPSTKPLEQRRLTFPRVWPRLSEGVWSGRGG